MSFSMRVLTRRALIAATAGVLALGTVAAAATTSLDELVELNLRAWSGEPELVAEVYAPDGVHTATFYDRTNEYTGPDEIAQVAGFPGAIEPIGPRIDLPAAEGDFRWVSFTTMAGGTACLFHASDGKIVRHDCLVPQYSYEHKPRNGLVVETHAAEIDEVVDRLDGKWGPGATVAGLAEVYAPDAVHSARFLTRTTSYVGPEEIIRVAGGSSTIKQVGPRVDFESVDGELAWAQANTISGGSVCLFQAIDGMITRHDCFAPYGG